MPPILKSVLKLIAVLIVIVMAFRVNWLVGVAAIVVILGYFVYVNRSAFYAQRGNLAYMKGDREQALIWMEKAYLSKAFLPKHQIGYGYLLMKTGDLTKAQQMFEEVLQMTKATDIRIQARLNIATVYWLQNKRDEALQILQELSQEVKNTLVYGNYGYFQILLGNVEEALTYNLEAYAYNDSDLTIMDNLAQNYYMLGRLEEAEEMYTKVMAKTPKHAESYYFYAQTLHKLGRTQEAREQLAIAQEKELALVTPLTKEDIALFASQLGKDEVEVVH
ncbi:tetratricopeptide repeat protein [Paenibacillus qinlingensis]|uniref:Tetratricopeptide (TPR) repeat protein n=1 Tax=Paenibacillus qinlingensis TaxID=1837343 RepID=A0ABU1P0P7_9BACL|nr:tetratricopeptide repeat protein [Paenibacillus qinlingensis]MDR6553320.1 tetratricopeptide (TPR) repeat protein [Paenibacillus qinlingensis]